MQNPHNSGFTLMELLVVIVILTVLGAFVAPKFLDQPEKARVTSTHTQIKAIGDALDMYKLDNFKYPTTQQGLKALVEKPTSKPTPKNWKDGGYMQNMPKDPWGNGYVYLSPGIKKDFDLMSYGADGKKGGEDENADISN
ncbi:MAG: type II secretion system major pseudopilin GspG [Alphaproteobacteria bacterium]|jgi:general secretion pathway protein G|nr:type II secretion system major pseudopilin GspG [Alphaproteobacteria bacterium]